MAKKLFILFFTVVLFTTLLEAQTRTILKANGQMSKNGVFFDNNEIQPVKLDRKAVRGYFTDHNIITDLETVLFNPMPATGNSNFGFFGQDVMIQWFQAPADMFIRRAGFNTNAVQDAHDGVEVKLVMFNWTLDEILNSGVTQWGYYPATGAPNDWTAFMDNADVTGDWFDLEGSGAGSPFGNDLWSDFGFGAPATAVPSGAVNVWQWVDMNLLGFEPTVARGEIVGVALKNTSADFGGVNDRIGFLASTEPGLPGFKFYCNGRTNNDLTTGGWWSREFTWDFALDVTLTGDTPPDITDLTVLGTTVDTGDREVTATITDDNPSGGGSGVGSASVMYSIDGGEFMAAPMTADGDVFTGVIPGQQPGTEVSYYVSATDVNQNESRFPLGTIDYRIFLVTRNNLIIINGEADSGYPTAYQMGVTFHDAGYAAWDCDLWAYGQVTPELLENYDNIFEFTLGGPDTYGNDPQAGAGTGGEEFYRDWLNAKSDRGLAIFGMEYLGSWNGYADIDFVAGDFVYDILGIAHSYNDVSYDGTAGQGEPSALTLVAEEHALNAPIIAAGYTATDLSYDSGFEVGYDNWMDGFDVAAKAGTVLMHTTTRGIAGAPDVRELPCLIHNVTAGGNNVIFGAFNPLSVQYDPDGDNGDNYVWVGYEDFFYPFQIATNVFGIMPVGISENEGVSPEEFKLSQNYPNPFNPSTKIEFSIPSNEFVTLKVYDILGSEVRTLVSDQFNAGSYEVDFNASNLATGMYIYELRAGSFIGAKKMILLK
jgi:hypothetical protein